MIKSISNSSSNSDNDNLNDVVLVTKEDIKIKKPKLYKVILLNDDYTPMEYVVNLLIKIFNKTESSAVQIMLAVHQKGSGICGIYTLEIAETKVNQTMDLAQQHQHPLQCTIEKE